LFITEKNTGLIRILKTDVVLATPFLDISTRISSSGERGLLGLAFHPDYANNGYFYVSYTRTTDGAIVIERFQVTANPDIADPSSGTVMLDPIPHPGQSNHNGGWIGFRPQDGNAGYLYISTGDGGSAGDPPCNAQNGNVLLGKILRIDVDDGDPLIPPSNPFVGNPNFLDEIWAYGLRNPWRCSFDRATGDLYIGDVGQGTREEISFQSASSLGGENFGWKVMEGTSCFGTGNCVSPPACNSPTLTDPIYDYAWGATGRCIIGGSVYRGCAIPGLSGTYFFADNSTDRIWSFRYDGTSVTEFTDRTAELAPAVGTINSPVAFAEDARGELYIVDHGASGELYKIVANVPPVATNLGFGKVGTNGFTPLFEMCGLLGTGETAEVILRRAPASTNAAFFLSGTLNPVVLPFGTLAPGAPFFSVPLVTDASGRIQLTFPGGIGPVSLYAQWVLVDIGATYNLGFSNALRIDWP
jgi:glucose/arabinose dehydrogenase